MPGHHHRRALRPIAARRQGYVGHPGRHPRDRFIHARRLRDGGRLVCGQCGQREHRDTPRSGPPAGGRRARRTTRRSNLRRWIAFFLSHRISSSFLLPHRRPRGGLTMAPRPVLAASALDIRFLCNTGPCQGRPRQTDRTPGSSQADGVARTRLLVTSEMSTGSRWTCNGKRSMRRASSAYGRSAQEPRSNATSSPK